MKQWLDKFLTTPKNHIWLLCALAVVLPFEYIPSYEVFDLRLRLSFFVGGLIIISAIWVYIKHPSRFKLSWPEYLILAWLLWIIIRSAGAEDFKAMARIIFPLVFYVALAISVRVLLKKNYIKSVIKWLLIGASLAVAFGFYQFAANWLGAPEWATGLRPQYSWQSFGFPRLQSTALEPLYFSAYLLLPFAVLISFMARSKNYRQPIYFGLLGAMLLADLLTISRGGLVALVIELMILGIFYISRLNVKTIGYIVAVFGVVLVVCFGVISLTARQGQDGDVTYGQKGVATFTAHLRNFSFFASSTNKSNDDSVGQRDRARAQARHTITDNTSVLLFGVGAGQYQVYTKAHYQNPDLGEPNNLILEQIVQYGLVGLSLFLIAGLSMLIGLFRLVQDKNWQLSALAVALIAYFVALILQAQTFTGLALTHLWFAVGLALFILQQQSVNQKKANKKQTSV